MYYMCVCVCVLYLHIRFTYKDFVYNEIRLYNDIRSPYRSIRRQGNTQKGRSYRQKFMEEIIRMAQKTSTISLVMRRTVN